MSFEEKYDRYRQTDRFPVPEGYVDDMAQRVSDRVSQRHTVPAFRVWSVSLSAVAVLALGWFLYPLLSPTPQTGSPAVAQSGTAERSLAAVTGIEPSEEQSIPDPDTGTYAVAQNETPSEVTVDNLSREDIMEYLLDEGFEEI